MQCQHGSIKCPVVGVPRDHTGVLFHAVPLTYMCIHTHTYTEKTSEWSACWAKGNISNRPCHCYLHLACGSNRIILRLMYHNPAESLYTL